MDLDALNTRLAAVQAAYSDVKNNAESFPEGGTPAYFYEGMASQVDAAEDYATSAGAFYNGAVTAKIAAETAQSAAETAKSDAVAAKDAAVASSGTAVEAKNAAIDAKDAAVEAKDAAVAAAELAETKVAGAAQVGGNNEFTGNNTFFGVNTFNGALAVNNSLEVSENGSLTYKSQELNNLLSYPIAAQLIAAGINPASALATTWKEWKDMNPNWQSLDNLLFYAPLITGAVGDDLPTNVTAPDKSCTFISPDIARTVSSAYMFGRHVKYFTWRGGVNGEMFDCYHVKDCDFYAPNATTLTTALNAIGYLTIGTALSLNVYVPSVTAIGNYANPTVNDTFYRIGLLYSFSIYAPELKTSFNFSRRTNKADDSRYNIGQTCDILHKLIEGIGEPDKIDPDTGLETEPQTITTLPPSDGNTVVEAEKTRLDILNEAAAAKHWKFNFETYQNPQ